jgi:NAD-dependent dihydropyrimidine dehydrogenase PreA subunit
MSRLVYLKDVATLKIDEAMCSGCGMCLEVCPHEVFSMNGAKVRIRNRDACMECGACSRNCPAGALTVKAGVGCAVAVINGMLGRTDSACCCVVEEHTSTDESRDRTGCC